MTLVTGTPLGNVDTQEEIYFDSAPTIFFQDAAAGLLYTPDAQGFYWGLSGTTAYPVYQMGCVEGVQLSGNLEMQDIRCDTVGSKGVIQKMNYIDLKFNLKTLLPATHLAKILRAGPVTTVSGATEQFGFGQPNNKQFYHVYTPSVYDPDTGDYIAITLFKAQFVDAWQLSFNFAQPATVAVNFRAFADDTKPAAQLFGSFLRADPSAIS